METTEHQKTTKVCAHCKQEKPLSEFGVKKRTKDGLNPYCKECVRKTQKELRVRKQNNYRKLALSQFTPRELMEELAKRGYKGKLEYTHVEVIDIQKF